VRPPRHVLDAIGALVQRPIASELQEDARNGGFVLKGHYKLYMNPSVLVLDLRRVTSAAPVDLFRGIFQSAAAFAKANRKFDRVILSRSGKEVFSMKGDDFHELGSEFTGGQNPIYLIRTLPAILYRPSGERAFGEWTGGWIGVIGKQMEDANQFGQQWADAK
jgi:hypothetical protein